MRDLLRCTLIAQLCLYGCNSATPPASPTGASPSAATGYGYDPYAYSDPASISFLDQVSSQTTPDAAIAHLELTTPTGKPVVLSQFLQSTNLVVVITRGYAGSICPYCSTQTSRLIANYEQIKERGAEVVVIYPLESDNDLPRTQEFLATTNGIISRPGTEPPPFPLLVDVGLKAVDLLGIRKDLSKPATYILDQTGAIRFAYVGESLADRPSIKAILQQLEALGPPAATQDPATTTRAPNPAVTDPPVAGPAAAEKG